MALPTWVGIGTAAAGIGNITPTIPAGATTNDILILVVESNSGQPVASVTDWTQFPDSPQDEGGAGSTCLSVFWKRHDGSESNPTITDTGNHTHGVIIAVRGCITTGNPYDVTAGNVANATTTAVSVPGDTTTVNDCFIVGAATHGTDAASGTAEYDNTWANASLANLTERYDNCTNAGGGGGMGIFTGEKATAGAVSATTATLDTASEQGRFFVALKPPAGGTAHSMATTIAGTGAVAAALKPNRGLRVTIAGVGAVAPALRAGFGLRTTISGVAAVSPNLAAQQNHTLASVIAGVGTVAPALRAGLALRTTIAGQGAVAPSLSLAASLAAVINAQLTVVPVLDTDDGVAETAAYTLANYHRLGSKRGR